jgi:hypothetical protein
VAASKVQANRAAQTPSRTMLTVISPRFCGKAHLCEDGLAEVHATRPSEAGQRGREKEEEEAQKTSGRVAHAQWEVTEQCKTQEGHGSPSASSATLPRVPGRELDRVVLPGSGAGGESVIVLQQRVAVLQVPPVAQQMRLQVRAGG